MKIAFTCAIGVFALAPCSAAVPGQFISCDGYGAPNEHGDGITKEASGFLGIFQPEPGRGNMRMLGTSFSKDGIAACDAVLTDARLLPAYWIRRASLLRARAAHRLAIGDTKTALADLDAAEALATEKQDPFFNRSLGLGIKLLRAYGYAIGGDPTQAAALADAVGRARPYAAGLRISAAQIRLMATHDRNAYAVELSDAARIDSSVLPTLLATEFEAGRFLEVVQRRPQIIFSTTRASGGFLPEDAGRSEARLFILELQLDSLNAFALAKIGRPAEGEKLLADVRRRIALFSRGPSSNVIVTSQSKQEGERLYAEVAKQVRPLTELVDETARLIGLLAIAKTGDSSKLLAELGSKRLPLDASGVAVLETLAEHAPSERVELAPIIADMKKKIAAANSPMPVKMEDIYAALPEAETKQRVPKYRVAKNLIGESLPNGFKVIPLNRPDRFVVEFGGATSSAAIVEEMALLRAADLARRAGKKGMILISRRVYTRTATTTSIYGSTQTPMGYSAELLVALVDPDGLPEDLKASSPRVLDPDQVFDALSPIYLASD